MASPVLSISQALANESQYGNIRQALQFVTATTSAATTTSGGSTSQRMGSYTVPTLSGATYYYMTSYKEWVGTNTASFPALEVTLGTLTVSGNSFSSGSSMPTRTIQGGSSTQLATSKAVLVVTTVMTATAPVITITYTNQAGTTGHTATLTLGNNPIANSVYFLEQHLQSGDTGIRAVTNISTSAGSAGVLTVLGLLPLSSHPGNTAGASIYNGILQNAITLYPLQAADVVGFYRNTNTSGVNLITFNLAPGS